MVLGRESRTKGLGEKRVVEYGDFVVGGGLAVNEALNGIAVIVENKATMYQ
jgi:hypothetical protein